MSPTRRPTATAATLDVGGGLRLPLTAVTETFAILAKRGAGKTNTAVVLTEEVGIELTGGTYGTYLSTLRRNGLVDEGNGQLHAADVLFLAPGTKR